MLSEDTADRLGWATMNDLLKLAPQICDIISVGRLLRLFNHGLLVDLQCLLAHNLYLIVSAVVIVPNFTACNRISDSEKEGLLLSAGKSIGQLDCKGKAVHATI
jgi:hypothetical protein